MTEKVVIKQGDHPIVIERLPLEVQWVVNRLNNHGYLAYLVGGGVRDILLGKKPKDFDITTNARPEAITKLFFNSQVIGKRFRIVHIYFRDGRFLEISTFRKLPRPLGCKHSPRLEDNAFGNPQEDAWRRDLTINGLFYDTATGDLIDYVSGLEDLEYHLVRSIGPPDKRFCEDPVRMLRAIRHTARHNFAMEPETWRAIQGHAHELKYCSANRLFGEFSKELGSGHSYPSLRLMFESKLLAGWLPTLHRWIKRPPKPVAILEKRFGPFITTAWGQRDAFWKSLQTCDDIAKTKPDPLSFLVLLGALLLPIGWSYIFSNYRRKRGTGQLWSESIRKGLTPILNELCLSGFMREKLTQLFHCYWRFHLVLQQPGIRGYLLRSEYFCEAFQLFEINLRAHSIPLPPQFLEYKEICEERKLY